MNHLFVKGVYAMNLEKEGGNFYAYREQMVWDAVNFAWKCHEGQTRADGKTPFIFHALAVMIKTAEYTENPNTWIAAVLHDVIENAPDKTTYSEIFNLFGPEVADMVNRLTRQEDETYEEYIDSICTHGGLEVIYIKLADNWHNTETIKFVPDPEKQDRLKQKYIFAKLKLQLALTRLNAV